MFTERLRLARWHLLPHAANRATGRREFVVHARLRRAAERGIRPRAASDETASNLPIRPGPWEVNCPGGCRFEETAQITVPEARLRQAASRNAPYRIKIFSEQREDIVEIPAEAIGQVFASMGMQRRLVRDR